MLFSTGLSSAAFDYIAYAAYPELVKRFVQVHRASLEYIGNNREESLKMTAEETGLTVEMVKQMYPWYDFAPHIKPSDIEELKRPRSFGEKRHADQNRRYRAADRQAGRTGGRG